MLLQCVLVLKKAIICKQPLAERAELFKKIKETNIRIHVLYQDWQAAVVVLIYALEHS